MSAARSSTGDDGMPTEDDGVPDRRDGAGSAGDVASVGVDRTPDLLPIDPQDPLGLPGAGLVAAQLVDDALPDEDGLDEVRAR